MATIDVEEPCSYFAFMGLFSRDKSNKNVQGAPSLEPVIQKFQNWIPGNLDEMVNGKKYSADSLRKEVASLVKAAAQIEDIQLLQFVGKACAGFTDQIRSETVKNIAQWVYDIAAVSLELQNRYRDKPDELASIKALGLLAHEQVKNLSNYSKVLDYLGENAKKLDENRA